MRYVLYFMIALGAASGTYHRFVKDCYVENAGKPIVISLLVGLFWPLTAGDWLVEPNWQPPTQCKGLGHG